MIAPPEYTIEEELADRDRLRREISRDAIREMVCDSLSDELCDLIRRHWITAVPKGCSPVERALYDQVRDMMEAYEDHEIIQIRG